MACPLSGVPVSAALEHLPRRTASAPARPGSGPAPAVSPPCDRSRSSCESPPAPGPTRRWRRRESAECCGNSARARRPSCRETGPENRECSARWRRGTNKSTGHRRRQRSAPARWGRGPRRISACSVLVSWYSSTRIASNRERIERGRLGRAKQGVPEQQQIVVVEDGLRLFAVDVRVKEPLQGVDVLRHQGNAVRPHRPAAAGS